MTDAGSRFVGPVVRAYFSVPVPPEVVALLLVGLDTALLPPGADVPAPVGAALLVGAAALLEDRLTGVLGVEQAAASGPRTSRPALPTPNRRTERREMLSDMMISSLGGRPTGVGRDGGTAAGITRGDAAVVDAPVAAIAGGRAPPAPPAPRR